MRVVLKLLPEGTSEVANMHPDRVLGKRILLVDDQQGVRTAIKFLLQMDEHKVTEATNGKQALELFLRERFDLVITDYAMPGMVGSELAASIKTEAPSQPIIMISAYKPELRDCENPVDAMLNKPFSFFELRQIIAKLLASRSGVTANATC